MAKNVYEKALEIYSSGRFLQLEGSFGRAFVNDYLDSGVIKVLDEPGNEVVDGYGRKIQLKKGVIDYDLIDELNLSEPDFIDYLEGGAK